MCAQVLPRGDGRRPRWVGCVKPEVVGSRGSTPRGPGHGGPAILLARGGRRGREGEGHLSGTSLLPLGESVHLAGDQLRSGPKDTGAPELLLGPAGSASPSATATPPGAPRRLPEHVPTVQRGEARRLVTLWGFNTHQWKGTAAVGSDSAPRGTQRCPWLLFRACSRSPCQGHGRRRLGETQEQRQSLGAGLCAGLGEDHHCPSV